jgi:hypothetical protein
LNIKGDLPDGTRVFHVFKKFGHRLLPAHGHLLQQ